MGDSDRDAWWVSASYCACCGPGLSATLIGPRRRLWLTCADLCWPEATLAPDVVAGALAAGSEGSGLPRTPDTPDLSDLSPGAGFVRLRHGPVRKMTFLRESAGRTRRLGCACLSFGFAMVLLAACSADTTSPPSASSAAKGRSSATATASQPTTPRNVTTTTAPLQTTTTTSPGQATTTTAPFLTPTTASGASQPLDTAQHSHGVF